MSEAADGGAVQDARACALACRFCREPLRAGAIYCKTCEQFQTPGARFRDGITVSALLGLLPLLALIWGFIQDRTVRTYSAVQALPVRCGTGELVVGLSNGGNRAAIVGGGTLHRDEAGTTTQWPLANASSAGALIIDPAKPMIATFAVGGVALGEPPPGREGVTCVYRVALQVMEFGATAPREEQATCPCPAG